MSEIPAGDKGERIAKVMARAGLCSRRDAERWIAAGRVAVNGQVLDSPAFTVTETDMVVVDGQPLPSRAQPKLWRYHKPAGLVTTHSDPQGRPTVFQNLPDDLGRVISVGRLDLNTEGLLLLTNDGGLARDLELPARGWSRRYRVRVHGRVNEDALAGLAKGVTVDGVKYRPAQAVLDSVKGANAWLTVTLTEGKNREIRHLMEHLGLAVNRLIRISYGPFQLGSLERGAVATVPSKVLRDQLGQGKSAKADEDEAAGGGDGRAKSAKNGKAGRTAKPPRTSKRDARPGRTRDDQGNGAKHTGARNGAQTDDVKRDRVQAGRAQTGRAQAGGTDERSAARPARAKPGAGIKSAGSRLTGAKPTRDRPAEGKPTRGRSADGKPADTKSGASITSARPAGGGKTSGGGAKKHANHRRKP